MWIVLGKRGRAISNGNKIAGKTFFLNSFQFLLDISKIIEEFLQDVNEKVDFFLNSFFRLTLKIYCVK